MRCRACQSYSLRLGLDLGMLPLANAFVKPGEEDREKKYPLQVFRCEDCGLIQLADVVDRREMFDEYLFLTSASQGTQVHFGQYADMVSRYASLMRDDLVMDIGSNDGTLLRYFKARGMRVLGVEPAQNIVELANRNGIETVQGYFDSDIELRPAKVITANNVISHVPHLHYFIEKVHDLLLPEGLFVFEVPWVVDVIRHTNFDLMYHEHMSYFGFKSLAQVLKEHELELCSLYYFEKIHGGTLRGIACHTGDYPVDRNSLETVFRTEGKLSNNRSLKKLESKIMVFRSDLMDLLESLKKEGKTISGYGAPAKATVILNYFGIGKEILDFVSDTTPTKQGRLMPGVHIPIVSPDQFHIMKPDYALILAWNYTEEILKKEEDYIRSGGKFIIPFPRLRVYP